ncbi:MAG: hypothetical protein ABJM29_17740 [Rhizobiaceae bacterium]
MTKFISTVLGVVGCMFFIQSASAWEWKTGIPSSYKDGRWRGEAPHACPSNQQAKCHDFDEHLWFPATKGETSGVCNAPTMKAYCNNVAPNFGQYLYVGKAPQQCILGNWSNHICPNAAGWRVVARDKYGDGYLKCQTGHIYLCVKDPF